MKKFPLFLISIFVLCLLNSCGGGSSSPPPVIATHFSVIPASSTAAAGTAFDFTVTAIDASNNVATSYSGTVHFTSTDAQAALPGDSTVINGTKTVSATLNTVGGQTITVTDTMAPSITGTSDSITVSGAILSFGVLYTFMGGADGGSSFAGVILDPSGNLYGTTEIGGAFQSGTVFKVDQSGVETVLYSFTGGADGGQPQTGLVRDSAGSLYGTVASGSGGVFKLDTTGKETTLYTFSGGADGGFPHSGLVRDAAGNLYGATISGGDTTCAASGCGVVFKIDASGNETVLHNFTGPDGVEPFGNLAQDAAGNLYGVTMNGGSPSGCFANAGCGTVFKVDASGTFTVLHAFNGTDGGNPDAGLVLDAEGNLYGTTSAGGAFGFGVVFKMDPTGAETLFYNFTGGTDGNAPFGVLARDTAGNLYGTTNSGGDLSNCFGVGCGVVFKLDASGNETVLHSFTGGADGANLIAGLVLDLAGHLYGVANGGGAAGFGVVFKL
jgi:uncharacterized repeat protein (TIGR03803 family)